jgi:hypothetical protein
VQTHRYDYLPIVRRKPFTWPDEARVALMVAPNVEFFHVDKVIPGAPNSSLPDVTGYALRDYGSRIGVFRMMDVLDKHGVRATVLLNADVCAHHPAIIDEGNKRNWEWLGHGCDQQYSHESISRGRRTRGYPADSRYHSHRALVRRRAAGLVPAAATRVRRLSIISRRRDLTMCATGDSTINLVPCGWHRAG